MQTCEKLDNARGPYISNPQELEAWKKRSQEFDSPPYPAYWMSISDETEEGRWRDWFTGDIMNISYFHYSEQESVTPGKFIKNLFTPIINNLL